MSALDPLDALLLLNLPWRSRARALRHLLQGRPLDRISRSELASKGKDEVLRAAAGRSFDAALAAGQFLIPAGHADYPRQLLELHDPPPILFGRGRRELLGRRPAVGVVGSRRASPAGLRISEELGQGLGEAQIPVISGLARGIDAAAHRGCLRAGGIPIGVVATGLDRAYPAGHLHLHQQVAEAGLLLSEQPPGQSPRPWQFLARNRILAALGDALVVVEAAARSGALSTADFCLQLGLDLYAVPGSVENPLAAGCLELLRSGAGLIRESGDLLEALGRERPIRGQLVLGLGPEPESPAALAQRLGRSLPDLLVELAELEMRGEVERTPGGRFRGRRALAPKGRRA